MTDELDAEFERLTGRSPKKDLSFGAEGESIIDVLDRADLEAHGRGLHDDMPRAGCPACEEVSE